MHTTEQVVNFTNENNNSDTYSTNMASSTRKLTMCTFSINFSVICLFNKVKVKMLLFYKYNITNTYEILLEHKDNLHSDISYFV